VSEEPAIRAARADDAAALARMHRDVGRYYAELAPADFRIPDEAGLVEYCRADLVAGDDRLWLVAELGGEAVGMLFARLEPPLPEARFEVNATLDETRLHIDYLVTGVRHRRRGVATALVLAAERWGRERGATTASADTYAASPVSAPFWQRRMGYRTRSLVLVKSLD